MDLLKEFTSKDFVEQITILQEIENQKNHEALPELIELCKTLPSDGSLSYMLENALKAVLSENESETVNQLSSDHIRLKRLCIQLCGRKQFVSAGPVLIDMLETTSEPDLLFETFSALSRIRQPEHLSVFQKNMFHSASTISALCIEMIGDYGDESSVPVLCDILERAEQDDRFEECDLTTINAIEALARIKSADAVSFLCSKIHHRNPKARQIIHDQLLQIGTDILPYLSKYFERNDVDLKIMAANILGNLGLKEGGDILVDAIDKGAAHHPNIKFAIYEAFGKIFFMKGLVCLMDGLNEEDDSVFMAVVSALDNQINPGIIKKIKEITVAGDAQSQRMIKTIVSAKALSMFAALYGDDPQIADLLIDGVSASKDPEVIAAFIEKLNILSGDRAEADAKKLTELSLTSSGKRILAVDDSAPMLLFYRSIASTLGYDIVTAVNGREALNCLEKDSEFDLIISDMNMPVMDGIEFTREVRSNLFISDIPIVMVTTESESSQVRLAESAGVTGFMKKPFTADALQAKICEFI